MPSSSLHSSPSAHPINIGNPQGSEQKKPSYNLIHQSIAANLLLLFQLSSVS